MREFEITRMTAADVADVAALEAVCFSDPWSEASVASELDNPLSLWLVARDAAGLLGYIGSQSVPDEADMMNLAVRPDARRQGVAQALLRALEAALRENGREPSVLAMAQAAGTTPEELMLLLEADRTPVSYDEPDRPLAALPDPRSDRWLTRLLIRDILSRMPETEGWLLVQRFALGRSQGALARALNTSQSSVSRRETLARRHFIAQWNA